MQEITTEQFENLLSMSESSTLDFKKQMYDFDNDTNNEKAAKYIKDIISFCNTVRTQSSYIIVGIEEKEEGAKELCGLDNHIDESILQAKVKGKVFPQPNFKYYSFKYKNKLFGVFEFPITKYETPIVASTQMKGLIVGMAYYRNGSSNAEAIGHTLISISDWLRSINTNSNDKTITEKAAELLKNAVNKNTMLSEVIADALVLSKEFNLLDLKEFCTEEITGYKNLSQISNYEKYSYRIYKTFFSLGTYTHTIGTVTPQHIANFLKQHDNYYEYNLLYNFTITEIETYISNSADNKTYARQSSTIKKALPDYEGKDTEITFYIFHDSFKAVHSNIRQKLIELILVI